MLYCIEYVGKWPRSVLLNFLVWKHWRDAILNLDGKRVYKSKKRQLLFMVVAFAFPSFVYLFLWWFVLEMNGELDNCWMIGLPIIEK